MMGQFAAQAVNARTETSMLTEALVKRDLTLQNSMRIQKQFNNILREQYQLQRATMATYGSTGANGRTSGDIIIPQAASARMNAYTSSLKENAKGLLQMGRNSAAFSDAVSVMNQRVGLSSAILRASSESMIKWGKNTQWAGRQLMVGFTVPLMAFGAVAGKAAYDVDKSMTRIAKVYDTTANTVMGKEKELSALRNESMSTSTQIAQQYGQAVKDTLDIQADLAATGQRGAELQQSTVAVTRAATLGELDRQQAIKATIALQSVYGHSAEELAKDFNYMNSIENATSLSMQDFVDAIPRGAGVMKALGVDLREMGILLVALKQNGIGATEGMNGLRSASQRLLTITGPAADAWERLLPNEKSLEAVTKSTNRQFIPTLEKIGEIMRQNNLDSDDQQEIIARVFGVYQSNKLYSVLDGLINKTEQVKTAYEIMNQDIADGGAAAATTAQNELDKMAESASGKFKRAVEGIKAQLAAVGEPFLEVASVMLGWISKLFDMFTSLPSGVKKFISAIVLIGAVLGPIIMLVGLFANLFGNIFKFVGFIGMLVTRFKPLTIEQRAQQMMANQTSIAWQNEGRAAQVLSAQLAGLTAQMERVALANMQMAGTGITSLRPTTPNTTGAIIGGIGPAAPPATSPYAVNAAGRHYNTSTGRLVSQREMAAYTAAQAAAARSAAQTAAATTSTARNWGKISLAMGGVGVMAASMMAASGSSSQIMNYLSMALLSASLLGPMLVNAFRSAGIAAAASNMASMFGTGRRAGAIAGRGGVGRFASGLSAALPAAGRLGMLIARFAGPAGLLATGAYMAFKLYGNMKKGVETQKRINESAKDWADVLGFVYQEAGQIETKNGEIVNTLDAQVTKLKEKNKELVKSLQLAREAGDEEKAMNLAIAEGLKVRNHGGTGADATNAAKLSLRAAGYTSAEIEPLMVKIKAQVDFNDAKSSLNAQMEQFKKTFNQVANNKFGQGGWEGFSRAFSGTGEINKNAAERGKGMANEFWTAFQAQTTMSSRKNYFDQFFKQIEAEHHVAWGRLGNSNRADLKKVGIESWEEFAQAYKDAQSMDDIEFKNKWADGDIEQAKKVKQALRGLGGETREYAEKHMDAEKFIAREIAKKNNMSDEEIKKIETVSDLYGKLDMAFYTVAQAQKAYTQAMNNYNREGTKLSKTEQLRILNIYRKNAGLKNATSIEQGFGDVIDKSTGKVKENADALGDAALSMDDWNNARQKSFSGAQDYVLQEADNVWQEKADAEVQAIEDYAKRREDALDAQAERADARFDARQEAADKRFDARGDAIDDKYDARAEAADKRFDKRAKSLESRWDKTMENFDNKWEARLKKEEDAYNKKIDNIRKAIEAEEKAEEQRQKIFEAEQTRLQRMAEIANQNIDFNIALNSGNLDEAAKIANNIQSTTDSWTLDDAAEASQSSSDKRKEKMEGQIDTLEKARDKRLEDLKKIEEAEKKALEAKKQREQEALQAERERYTKALQAQREHEQKSLAAERERYNKSLAAERERYRKGIEAQKKAIQEQATRDANAKRKELERQKKTLELELLAVRASIPRNKKEYDKQIKTIEGLYKKYGVNLKAQGNSWANTVGDALTKHVKEASADLQNQIKWKSIGNSVTQDMVDGGFNLSTSQFMKWVTTGELPKSYKAPAKPKTRHKGGPVNGSSKYDNRGGRNWGTGMRRDESLMLLKNDEYVLNGRAHKALGTSNLDRINKGDVNNINTGGIGGASDGLGLVGAFAAGMEGLYESAAQMAIESAGNQAMGYGIDGMAIAGAAGMYGNVRLSNEQLNNAAAIIGVGKSLGATTRDNIIAIMTAMQESTLRNLTYGDRDSVGLFQQRNAWGSFADRTNPSKSARMFFLGGAAGQRGLFDFPNRNQMSLAQAAQAVQVSAFPSAYAKWEDMARAVVSGTAFQPFGGTGGGPKQRPVNSPVSRSYANHSNLPRATDFGSPVGTPVRAAMNGVVTTSADLRSGNGYRSYGRYIVIQGGNEKTLYAHLSDRGVSAGRQVRAGQLIGYSGNTGNSSGPHLHFETWRNGKTVSPGAFGIPGMKTGGFTLNDGLAMLHKKETVLTAPLSEQLKSGIQKIDQGVNNDYNVTIDLRGAYIREEVDIEKAVNSAISKRESKLGRNRSITT